MAAQVTTGVFYGSILWFSEYFWKDEDNGGWYIRVSLLLLLVGFFYIIKKKALEWE